MNIIKLLFASLFKSYQRVKFGKISTFTYFIPAPPVRKTGYREKEFDKLILKITELGFELLEIHTQEISSKGLIVIVKIQALTAKAQQANINFFDENAEIELEHSETNSKNEVEGLYYID